MKDCRKEEELRNWRLNMQKQIIEVERCRVASALPSPVLNAIVNLVRDLQTMVSGRIEP